MSIQFLKISCPVRESFAAAQFLISNYHGPWVVDIAGAAVSIVCLIILLKVWQPRTVWRFEHERAANAAAGLVRDNPRLVDPAGGVLHLMAKRNDGAAVKWLLAHGADPNGRWAHWDADVTPLHLAVLAGHADIARLLLESGADPHIRASKHNSDAIGWAEFFGNAEMVKILKTQTTKT